MRTYNHVKGNFSLEYFTTGFCYQASELPDGQVKVFEEFKIQENCEINLLIKTFLGLVEMMFGLVNVSFSLPEWQAVKMTFFAPCQLRSRKKNSREEGYPFPAKNSGRNSHMK